MNLKQPLSPGQFVQKAMDQKGWNQSDLAFALGATTASINQILNDKRGISQNMARALSAAFGMQAEEFVTVQARWDMQNAETPDPGVVARGRILSAYPLRDMVKRGWIDPESTKRTLEEQICGFFAVSSLDDVPHLAHAAKRT